jgi:ribosomal protein S18 acetylase RimI-like enzyme
MEIEYLTEKDLNALAGLFMQFWGESSAVENMSVIFERLWQDPDYALLAAKQGDVLAGFCMRIVCQSLYGDCRPFMVIEDFIVDKEHRRTGIGTALLSAAERHAVRRGCSQVIFVTENDRRAAHSFYSARDYSPAQGFQKTVERRRPVHQSSEREVIVFFRHRLHGSR